MSEKIMEQMRLIEAAVERLGQEKREQATSNAISFAMGYAAGITARDAKKDQKGA